MGGVAWGSAGQRFACMRRWWRELRRDEGQAACKGDASSIIGVAGDVLEVYWRCTGPFEKRLPNRDMWASWLATVEGV